MRLMPLMLISVLLSAFPLHCASVNGGNEIRTDLFYSTEELAKEDFSAELSDAEKDYFENVKVYLLTASPSDPVYVYFGHSGIVIDPPDGDAVMYDWGTFGFSDGFYMNFTLGLLYYSVSSGWADQRISNFVYDDRTVTLLELDLSPEAKSALVRFCSRNMLPENRTYLYHYYKDNCATRIRDLYDSATGGAFGEWAESVKTGKSYREWAMPYFAPSFFFAYLLNYLQGPEIDENLTLYDACFLPLVLEESIEEFEGRESTVVYHTETRKDTPASYSLTLRTVPAAALLAIAPLLTISKRKWLRRTGDVIAFAEELFLGLMASVLLFMMLFTNHDVTYWNINAAVISPLLIVTAAVHLASLGYKERRKTLFRLFLLSSALMLLALVFQTVTPFHQNNAPYYISASVLYASELFSSRYAFRRSLRSHRKDARDR